MDVVDGCPGVCEGQVPVSPNATDRTDHAHAYVLQNFFVSLDLNAVVGYGHHACICFKPCIYSFKRLNTYTFRTPGQPQWVAKFYNT
jgi:hypothetical protein